MHHPKRLAGVSLLVHRHEHRKLLVRVASDKLFHIAAAPPCAWGFARSLRKTPLQRFHSIIIGGEFIRWRRRHPHSRNILTDPSILMKSDTAQIRLVRW